VGPERSSGIVAAAQDLGLVTAEFQHCTLSPYHFGYHYPGRPFVPYATNWLLSFGSFWNQVIDRPSNMRVAVVGSQNLARTTSATHRTPHQVLVLSQDTIGARLLEATILAARESPDWTFVFRPHPFDDLEGYCRRIDQQPEKLANLRISGPDEDTYQLLATTDVQIGVYSTALFEGMALGARTIILDLPGAERMLGATEMGDAVLARSPAEIGALLPTAPVCRDRERYYAPPVPSILKVLEGS